MQRLIDKLKPCRFCGSSKLTTKNILTNGMPLVGIVCRCGCELTAPTAHEAVKKWNERREGIDEQREADQDKPV